MYFYSFTTSSSVQRNTFHPHMITRTENAMIFRHFEDRILLFSSVGGFCLLNHFEINNFCHFSRMLIAFLIMQFHLIHHKRNNQSHGFQYQLFHEVPSTSVIKIGSTANQSQIFVVVVMLNSINFELFIIVFCYNEILLQCIYTSYHEILHAKFSFCLVLFIF